MQKIIALISLLVLVFFSCTAPVMEEEAGINRVQTVTVSRAAAGGDLSTDISASFTDPNFKLAIWEWLGNTGTPGSFTKQDLIDQLAVSNNRLFATQKNIVSLDGLEHFEGTGITFLHCGWNEINELPPLPSTLTVLKCYYNNLTSLPELPAGMIDIACDNNQLTSLPVLPATVTKLNCSQNQLTQIPTLPEGLYDLSCSYNPLTNGLPALPDSIHFLSIGNCNLTELPALPASLQQLSCGWNPELTTLPALPEGLTHMYVISNGLTSLPELPESLLLFNAAENKLTDLPVIKPNVYRFYLEKNYMNAFSGSIKDNIDASTASQKYYQPQYRFRTDSIVELSPGMIKDIIAEDLIKERTYDGLEWFTEGNGVITDFTFASSDASIATIDADGVITAVANGSCVISAYFAGQDAEYTTVTIPVTVSPLIPEWTTGVYYVVGDQVTYKSDVYECTYDNFALVGWEPDKPELWEVWKKL